MSGSGTAASSGVIAVAGAAFTNSYLQSRFTIICHLKTALLLRETAAREHIKHRYTYLAVEWPYSDRLLYWDGYIAYDSFKMYNDFRWFIC